MPQPVKRIWPRFWQRERDLREVEALNAFFIIPTLKGSVITELFSTHPSLENRLAALKRLEQEIEGR